MCASPGFWSQRCGAAALLLVQLHRRPCDHSLVCAPCLCRGSHRPAPSRRQAGQGLALCLRVHRWNQLPKVCFKEYYGAGEVPCRGPQVFCCLVGLAHSVAQGGQHLGAGRCRRTFPGPCIHFPVRQQDGQAQADGFPRSRVLWWPALRGYLLELATAVLDCFQRQERQSCRRLVRARARDAVSWSYGTDFDVFLRIFRMTYRRRTWKLSNPAWNPSSKRPPALVMATTARSRRSFRRTEVFVS
mmetsp:Transcript_124482/g.285216  ORF Transcript_124482/g.285216 Transcript_124482/m.285216 type:complete len:244 (-) Transcript_124482:12-743(-)